ncbi:hypothetical protein M9Y10_012766 [Tritrichomonas musculus]|uniref:Protein kinase domain-containing protein n=1 Tax=Tritrichomonas musculus TaxID=1915356 RepID=A0ABR2IES2_9EUKA
MNEGHSAFGPTINSQFYVISQVGRGGYGSVFKAIDLSNGEVVALKKVFTFDPHTGIPSSFYREIKCLKEMDGNENIVKLKQIIRSKEEHCFYLVLDYCEYDLCGLVHNYGLTYEQAQTYMKQILNAVRSMHSKEFVHRDLKPSNIFLTVENVVKVGDFGLTRKLDKTRPLTSKVITQSYRPPEVLLGDSHYGPAVDIWSLGCVFYEMITNKVLFCPSSSTDISQLMSIFSICGTPTQENWPGFDKLPNSNLIKNTKTIKSTLRELLERDVPQELSIIIDLLESMLQLDPSKRINIEQVMSHPFFADDFVLPALSYPETHAANIVSIPIARNIIKIDSLLMHERILPPPILV